MPPGPPFHFSFDHGLELVCCQFNVFIVPGFDLLRFETPSMRRPPELVTEIHNLMHQTPSTQLSIRIKSFLMRAIEFLAHGDEAAEVALRERYARLLDYVAGYADASTTVGELAELMGTSRDRLSRSFARDFNVSLKRYLSRLLVERAQARLSFETMKIRDVAAHLGFSSEYFSRFFRKHTGMTPSKYRKQSALL